MTRVVIDQDIFPLDRVRDGLPDSWDLEVGIDGDLDGIVTSLHSADVALVTSRIRITADVLSATDLDMIGKLGTGIDTIDIEAAAAADVPVTYTPGHNALSVAELTLGLLLGTARRFTEGRNRIEGGSWRDDVSLGVRISGKTVGIVGFGNVGKRLAGLLRGFGVDVLFFDPYVGPIEGEIVAAEPSDFGPLLERSDCVCLTAELTDETRGMIGTDELERMRSDAILVNTARGAVVDHEALVGALERNEIRGAGLDVFAEEPLAADDPILELDNVVVTPHLGGMTHSDRVKSIDRLTESVTSLSRGESIGDEFLAT